MFGFIILSGGTKDLVMQVSSLCPQVPSQISSQHKHFKQVSSQYKQVPSQVLIEDMQDMRQVLSQNKQVPSPVSS